MKLNSDNFKTFSVFFLVLIGVSTVISMLITNLIRSNNVLVPFYLDLPISIPAIHYAMFYSFNKWFWKFRVFKLLKITSFDDLNGVWTGELQTSFYEFNKPIKVELHIAQTATSVKIRGIFPNSKSISFNENFCFSEIDESTALFYFYRNEPTSAAINTMAMHEGAIKLVYDKKTDTLTGEYYSGRNRSNFGNIKVHRINKKSNS